VYFSYDAGFSFLFIKQVSGWVAIRNVSDYHVPDDDIRFARYMAHISNGKKSMSSTN